MGQDISRIRLAVLNLLVLSLLGTLLARLWFLQVLEGSQAQALAERTSVRLIYEQAPRGFVFDRNGDTLARNRTALTVALDVSAMRPETRDQELARLASVLGKPLEEITEIVEDPQYGPYTPRPLALDVDKDTVIYLREHQDEFPGVTDVEIPVREYPREAFASHVIGHIGEINEDELEASRERRPTRGEIDRGAVKYRPGDKIGKIGIERVYEDWLSGKPGIRKMAVDVAGEPVRQFNYEAPERGWDAVLTLDAALQGAAEDALARGLTLAKGLTDPDTGKLYKAPAGAVVALDANNGEVLALASAPDFDPNLFVGRADPKELRRLNSPEAEKPFLNRAIAEAVPPGSTFKPVTAAAAWEAGEVSPSSVFNCPGYFEVGNRRFRDWTPKGHGTVGLRRSLAESCDIVYYTVGVGMNARTDEIGEHLQEVARGFKFGSELGIDLLGEQDGLVADAAWKWKTFSYARTYDRRWFPGDSANLAIGQGFLQVTPLQLASAYAAIANGGTIYRPHVMRCLAKLDVSRPVAPGQACRGGVVPSSAAPKVVGRVDVAPSALAFIEESMAGTVVGDGTAASAFNGFPHDRVFVAGKTGTAQMKPRQPFSWFAAIAKADGREIVVVALVEEGGTGGQIASPIVRRMLDRYFGLPQGNFVAGSHAD